MSGGTTIGETRIRGPRRRGSGDELVLMIAWLSGALERIGEVLPCGDATSETPLLLGRGDGPVEDGERRAAFVRRRPGRDLPAAPLDNRRLSRRQLRIHVEGGSVHVENLGRLPMFWEGSETRSAVLGPGGCVALGRQLLLRCDRRPRRLLGLVSLKGEEPHPFGEPDADGIVGEGEAAWRLRDRLAFAGPRRDHVLVTGPTGTGKELAARALHRRSDRAEGRLVSRNAATIPDGLVDAELFGNVKNYPQSGMPGRPGMVGEADGSTLFLDELGELPVASQARLLRVLDRDGEYHRLGESTPRSVDLRLVGATNRDVSELKHDVAARLALHVEVPSLAERTEDLPLLVRHLLSRRAEEDTPLRERFFDHGQPELPRVGLELVEALLGHGWPRGMRELDAALLRSMASSRDDTLRLTPIVRVGLQADPDEEAEPAGTSPEDLTAEQVQAALDRHDGVRSKAFRDLGLRSRHQLARLIKKHGLVAGQTEP